MTSLSHSAESFIVGLEKAEADLKAVAHRLEEGFEQQYGRHQVRPLLTVSLAYSVKVGVLMPSGQSFRPFPTHQEA